MTRAGGALGASPPRILLVRPDHLGDVLLTLPAVEALRRALPSATLSYLVDRSVAAIPARCRGVDEAISLRFPPPDAPFDPPGWSRVVRATAPRLADRFDMAVLLRPEDAWSGALVAAADIPVRIGYAQAGTRPFLTHALPPESRERHGVQVAADVLAFAAQLAGTALRPLRAHGWPLATTPDDEREAVEALAPLAETTTWRPIVLQPGSGWQLKNWPASRWGRLARAIARRRGVRPLIVGGPGEDALVRAAVDAASGAAATIPSPVSLGALAALHRRARLVVAVDSGATHLAAAMGTPIVALFGPGDARMARPWCPPRRCRVVRVDLPCSPCGRMHDPPCGASVLPACVSAIGVGRVVAAVDEVLS
jgi:ADP-heptose:LPS heptosyltransferase